MFMLVYGTNPDGTNYSTPYYDFNGICNYFWHNLILIKGEYTV